MTQRELASRIGVHVHSLRGWEAGTSYPGVASLQALIAASLASGGFTAGREADEAAALWLAALREAPRLRTPFDRAWFDQISAGSRQRVRRDAVIAMPASESTPGAAQRQSWGEAPDVSAFLGRAAEREQVARWVESEGSRVVAVYGLGGIGKTLLATRLAHDLAPSFDRVFWRSLRDAPPPGDWLAEALGFLDPDAPNELRSDGERVRRLLEHLRSMRCLLVLDNFETLLRSGGRDASYRIGFEQYGSLLQQIAETPHRSCLILTSREEATHLQLLGGKHGPVRALHLGGLDPIDGRALLHDKRLTGNDEAWQSLVAKFGGNGFALQIIGETIREFFDGAIAEYLAFADSTPPGAVQDLLDTQVRRLSAVEADLLRWLAVEREPVSLAELAASLGPKLGRGMILEAVEGLRRRSLLERAQGNRCSACTQSCWSMSPIRSSRISLKS